MNSNVLTQTIVTGSDPRGLPEFSAIREEINKASHPSQPELNWKLVESLALAIFKANGVDLHTATYYTLARTRTQGLAGFCEGAELLAAMVTEAGINGEYISILIKVIVIAYICEFAVQFCADAGEKAIGAKIELAGRVLILAASLPILENLLRLIVNLAV